MERACESCGIPDDELVWVRRVYLDPKAIGQISSVQQSPELWCLSCSSQYPHQLVDRD